VRLIKTIPDRLFNDLTNTVYDGFSEGLSYSEIANDLEERYGVSESNAERIARDQVGKLNGALTQERQTNLGVVSYTWRGAMDERERDSHIAHEGRTYEWDDPPADTGHPGEDPMCRCYAEPVLEDLI
jgi:SPP1 gp7 family putative phage head morphogenesis protein